MIMENKTTELQNKKNTAAIFSDIRQQVEDGKGFLSVCLENRKQKKRSAARKSIDDLEYALKLLGQKPTKEEYGKKERSFYWKKLTRLFYHKTRCFTNRPHCPRNSPTAAALRQIPARSASRAAGRQCRVLRTFVAPKYRAMV